MRWLARELRDWWVGQRDPESRAFDRRHGTDTVWFDLFNYEPSLPSVVDDALDAVDLPLDACTFVDLGSGKGRVVCLASRRSFREVWGVERRWRLHRVAERNLARFVDQVAPMTPVRLIHGDARTAPLPDGPLVIYLYNPFRADVLAAVAARVADRPVRLVYVNPVHLDVLEAAGWTCLVAVDDADPLRTWRLLRGPDDVGEAELG